MRQAPPNHPEFQRAYAAIAYFAGVRGEGLHRPFDAPSTELERVVTALSAPEQSARAEALAQELERIVLRLDARRLGA